MTLPKLELEEIPTTPTIETKELQDTYSLHSSDDEENARSIRPTPTPYPDIILKEYQPFLNEGPVKIVNHKKEKELDSNNLLSCELLIC